jgi:cytochrome c-type biogenesis protein CcmE
MGRIATSIIIVIVAFAVFLMIQAGREGTLPVFIPSQLLAESVTKSAARIRIGGKVADMPIDYRVEPEFQLSFHLTDPGKVVDPATAATIPVIYRGIKPDMFAVGRDVIIDGEYRDGTVIAVKLLTQCPSKYQPPSPDHPTGQESR